MSPEIPTTDIEPRSEPDVTANEIDRAKRVFDDEIAGLSAVREQIGDEFRWTHHRTLSIESFLVWRDLFNPFNEPGPMLWGKLFWIVRIICLRASSS